MLEFLCVHIGRSSVRITDTPSFLMSKAARLTQITRFLMGPLAHRKSWYDAFCRPFPFSIALRAFDRCLRPWLKIDVRGKATVVSVGHKRGSLTLVERKALLAKIIKLSRDRPRNTERSRASPYACRRGRKFAQRETRETLDVRSTHEVFHTLAYG
jgi:hypothetical protein